MLSPCYGYRSAAISIVAGHAQHARLAFQPLFSRFLTHRRLRFKTLTPSRYIANLHAFHSEIYVSITSQYNKSESWTRPPMTEQPIKVERVKQHPSRRVNVFHLGLVAYSGIKLSEEIYAGISKLAHETDHFWYGPIPSNDNVMRR